MATSVSCPLKKQHCTSFDNIVFTCIKLVLFNACVEQQVTLGWIQFIVFPPAPKKGMVKFPGKGHFKRVTTG